VAGSDGTNGQCKAVLGDLGYPGVNVVNPVVSTGLGCAIREYSDSYIGCRHVDETTAEASMDIADATAYRACACNR
jgi:hypothetical protein